MDTQTHVCVCVFVTFLMLWFLLTDTDCSGGSAANFSVLSTTRDQVRLFLLLTVSLSCQFSFLVLFYDSQCSLAIHLRPVIVCPVLIISTLPLFVHISVTHLHANRSQPLLTLILPLFSVFLGHTNAQRDWHTRIKSLISVLYLSFILHLSRNTKFSREEQPDALMLLALDISEFI